MINIEYTKEMKKQDKLFNENSECVDTMEKLQKEIVKEAKRQGYEKYVLFRKYDNEHVTEIYESYQDCYNENFYDEKGNQLEFEEPFITASCNQLIEYITNKKINDTVELYASYKPIIQHSERIDIQ